jgi:hypothetical protein
MMECDDRDSTFILYNAVLQCQLLYVVDDYTDLTRILASQSMELTSTRALQLLIDNGCPDVTHLSFAFKSQSKSAQQGCIPISKSCFDHNVMPAVRHINGKVSHRPLDFTFPSRRLGVPIDLPVSIILPALFHGIFHIGKKIISMVQKLDIRGNEALTAREVPCYAVCSLVDQFTFRLYLYLYAGQDCSSEEYQCIDPPRYHHQLRRGTHNQPAYQLHKDQNDAQQS